MGNKFYKSLSFVFLIFIVFSVLLHADQNGSHSNVSKNHMPLRTALDSLSNQFNLCFIYDDEIVEDKVVNYHCPNDNPDVCLRQIVQPFHISVRKVTDVTFILYLNKQRTIYGHVFDADRNSPLVGANVFIKGTYIGMETGNTGAFRLVIPVDTEELTVRYMGYETQKIYLLHSPDGLHVPMNPIVIPMQPVEAVGQIDRNIDQRPSDEMRSHQRVLGNGLTPGVHAQMSGQLPEVEHVVDVFDDPKTGAKYGKEYDEIHYSPMLNQSADLMKKLVKPGQMNDNLTLIQGLRFYEAMHSSGIPGSGAYIYSREMMNSSEFFCGGFHVNHGDALGTVHDIQYQNGLGKSFGGKLSFHSFGQALFLAASDSNRFSIMAHAKRYDRKYLPNQNQSGREMHPLSQDVQTQFYYQLTQHHNLNGYLLFSKDRCRYSPIIQNSESQSTQFIDDQDMICNNVVDTEFSNRFQYSTSIASLGSAFQDDDKQSQIRISYYSKGWMDKFQSEYSISSSYPDESRFISEYETENITTLNLIERIFETDFRYEMNVSDRWQRQSGFLYRYFHCKRNYQWFQPTIWETNVPVEDYYGNFNQNHLLTTYYYSDEDEVSESVKGAKLSGYLLEKIRFLEKYILTAGIRINVNTLNQSTSVDPRMRLGYMHSDRFLLQFSWGIYSEMPVLYAVEWSDINSDKYENQKAMHSVLSTDIQATENLGFLLEGYYKLFWDFIPVQRHGDGVLTFLVESNRRRGNTLGLRAGLTFSKNIFHLESLYELRRSQEYIPELSQYHTRFDDQKHSFSSILSMDLRKSLVIRFSVNISSGFAYAPYNLSDSNVWTPSEIHSRHFPVFSRLDFAIEKSFDLPRGELRLNLRLINLLDQKNIYGYHYTFDSQQNPLKQPQILYGFLPLFGLDYTF